MHRCLEAGCLQKNQAPESEFLNLSLVFIGFLPDPDSKLSKSGNAFHDIQDFFNEQQDEWNGSRFPITQMGMARRIGTFKRAGDAASSPPRSSRIGIMEMIKMITSPDTFPPSREASPCTRVSVITYPHFSV